MACLNAIDNDWQLNEVLWAKLIENDRSTAKSWYPLLPLTLNRLVPSLNIKQAVRPVVGPPQYASAPCKWWLEQSPRAFSLEVTAHVGDAGHRTEYSICIPSLKFLGLPVPLIWLFFFGYGIKPCPLFDLSTCKWGHGSTRIMGFFLPIFSLLCPSAFDLGSGTWQTDIRTDNGNQCIMPSPIGSGAETRKVNVKKSTVTLQLECTLLMYEVSFLLCFYPCY